MELLRRRVRIEPAAAPRRRSPFEVAFVGHAPGRARLAALTPFARARLHELGFHELADPKLRAVATDEVADSARLHHVPLALRSATEFHELFPEALTVATRYASLLAGAIAWLPRAVEDFFRAGGEQLWVIVVPEPDTLGATMSSQPFFADPRAISPAEPTTWRGLAALLHLPAVGLVALPDLERLGVDAQLEDIPEKRLANPKPRFVPVGAPPPDPIAGDEKRSKDEMAKAHAPAPLALSEWVAPALDFLARWRPDVQFLCTLPIEGRSHGQLPGLATRGRDFLVQLRDAAGHDALPRDLADLRDRRLARLVPLFPFLRGPRFRMQSPAGLVAGAIAARADADGPWRSIAAQPLSTDAVPWPPVAGSDVADLRDEGIGVLLHERGAVRLDDERTAAVDDLYSSEVVRFVGWLHRELERFGLAFVFAPENEEVGVRLSLDQFFSELFRRGALTGATASDAFEIRPLPRREATIGFEIEFQPSLPIDRLVLSFVNDQGRWLVGAAHG